MARHRIKKGKKKQISHCISVLQKVIGRSRKTTARACRKLKRGRGRPPRKKR